VHAIDTNVLVRLLTRDDATQVTAAEAFIQEGAWVSHLVLAEATWVLIAGYGLTHSAIAHQRLTLEEPEVVSKALQHYRQRPALGFSDCLIVEIARRAGHLPLGTFDRALGRIPGAERL